MLCSCVLATLRKKQILKNIQKKTEEKTKKYLTFDFNSDILYSLVDRNILSNFQLNMRCEMRNMFLVAIATVSIGVASCSSSVALPNDPSNPIEQLEYQQALKEKRPDWASRGLWEEDDYIYQVGQSMVFDTEREAKKHAYRDASFRLSEYVNQQLNVEFSELLIAESTTTDTIGQSAASREMSKTISKSVISTIAPHETYVEVNIDDDEDIGYTAFAVVRVSKKAMKTAAKNAKERYIEEVEPQGEVASVDNL